MIHREIRVSLGERSYPIYVGTNILANFAPTCQQHEIPKRVIIITDTNVARHYLKPIESNLFHFQFEISSLVIPPGERQKSFARANKIFTELLQRGVGRKSAIVALGGGVIGDLAGFVAATYQRGVPYIQVPTTLLSQVDSSVGGKVAVNHPLGKNMIGAFYQPKFVWVDVECLQTLPEREVTCGLGEIIKYGIIRDAELFRYIETNLTEILKLDHEAIMHVQARCCEIKSQLVSQDEREAGVRVILNFGHTVGHALEAAGEYRALKHGEAVLLGMVAESHIARSMELIDSATYQRIEELIRRVPFKCRIDSLKASNVLQAMNRDKKAVGGKKRFVLPTRIGEVRVVENVGVRLVQGSLKLIMKMWGKK